MDPEWLAALLEGSCESPTAIPVKSRIRCPVSPVTAKIAKHMGLASGSAVVSASSLPVNEAKPREDRGGSRGGAGGGRGGSGGGGGRGGYGGGGGRRY